MELQLHCKTRDNYSVQFHLLPLRELYYEGNRFVNCEPMSSVQDVEVLTLKVKCHRSTNRTL